MIVIERARDRQRWEREHKERCSEKKGESLRDEKSRKRMKKMKREGVR